MDREIINILNLNNKRLKWSKLITYTIFLISIIYGSSIGLTVSLMSLFICLVYFKTVRDNYIEKVVSENKTFLNY